MRCTICGEEIPAQVAQLECSAACWLIAACREKKEGHDEKNQGKVS